MQSYKKLDVDKLKRDEFQMKEYFNYMKLGDVRTKFAIDNRMVKTVKSDFPSDPTYTDELWQCEECTRIDSIRHIKICPGYEELRADKDLRKDSDLVLYFQEVLAKRSENNE